MPNPLDISLELSVGAANPVAPIDISLDPEITDCGCDTDCDIQPITEPQKPPTGIAPTFSAPQAEVGSITNPVFSIIENTLSYNLDYTQNDGGSVEEVRVIVDEELAYTGGLIGSFPVDLDNGTHSVVFEVDYGQGEDLYDTAGNLVPNPIPPGTLEVSTTVTATYPFYSGSVAEIADIPGNDPAFPQLSNYYLNTGTVHRRFWIAVKQGATVLTAEDSHAMYLDVSGLFTFIKTITVSGINYSVYAMTNAIPYSVNHKFEFNVSY